MNISGTAAQRLTAMAAVLRPYVLVAGLLSIIVLTVPGLPFAELHWSEAILWSCLAFYVCEWALRVFAARDPAEPRRTLYGFFSVTDAITILPVPVALLFGVAPATAWLLAALWLVKIPAAASGFSLLRRVFTL